MTASNVMRHMESFQTSKACVRVPKCPSASWKVNLFGPFYEDVLLVGAVFQKEIKGTLACHTFAHTVWGFAFAGLQAGARSCSQALMSGTPGAVLAL